MRLLPLLTFTFASLPYYAYSYCVYNKHSDFTYMDVKQLGMTILGPFHKMIYPDGKECCPYTEYDCTMYDPGQLSHGRIAELEITRGNSGQTLNQFKVHCPPDGYVVVHGDKEHYNVTVKFAWGQDYDHRPPDKLQQ